jgi:hypothetical protein
VEAGTHPYFRGDQISKRTSAGRQGAVTSMPSSIWWPVGLMGRLGSLVFVVDMPAAGVPYNPGRSGSSSNNSITNLLYRWFTIRLRQRARLPIHDRRSPPAMDLAASLFRNHSGLQELGSRVLPFRCIQGRSVSPLIVPSEVLAVSFRNDCPNVALNPWTRLRWRPGRPSHSPTPTQPGRLFWRQSGELGHEH